MYELVLQLHGSMTMQICYVVSPFHIQNQERTPQCQIYKNKFCCLCNYSSVLFCYLPPFILYWKTIFYCQFPTYFSHINTLDMDQIAFDMLLWNSLYARGDTEWKASDLRYAVLGWICSVELPQIFLLGVRLERWLRLVNRGERCTNQQSAMWTELIHSIEW